MKKIIKLTESELKKLLKETLSEIEQTEPRIMSDDDIKAQYDDMKILNFKLEKTNFGGWSGTFELEFPNADNIDYDDYTINNFIVYDDEGKRIAWDNWMPDEDAHRLEEIIRGEIAKRLSENNGMELNESIDELDWKTYANAAKKRFGQLDDPDVEGLWKEKFDKAYDLEKMANQRFDDEFIGDMKYDRMGDSLSGKHSPSFNGIFNVTNSNMPYGVINGTNKGGGKIFSTDKGVYHTGTGGMVKPGTFFRDKETADKYEKANDELWDYNNGAYTYEKGKGWRKKDGLDESVNEIGDTPKGIYALAAVMGRSRVRHEKMNPDMPEDERERDTQTTRDAFDTMERNYLPKMYAHEKGKMSDKDFNKYKDDFKKASDDGYKYGYNYDSQLTNSIRKMVKEAIAEKGKNEKLDEAVKRTIRKYFK